MKYSEILATIKTLALSQGFYGRLLRGLEDLEASNPDKFDLQVQALEAQNFKDAVDIVLYFES